MYIIFTARQQIGTALYSSIRQHDIIVMMMSHEPCVNKVCKVRRRERERVGKKTAGKQIVINNRSVVCKRMRGTNGERRRENSAEFYAFFL